MARSSFLESDNPVDFLYLDRNRIFSLIGQLSDKGVLTQYKSVLLKNQATELQGSGNAKVVNVQGKRSTTKAESAEETYDPFWTHAFSFLRDLEQNFAVPLDQARLGSLITFEALIQFVDLRMMKNLWEPSMQAALLAEQESAAKAGNGNRKKRREQRAEIAQPLKLILQVMKELPHLLHMTFVSSSGVRLWAAIQQEYLTINSEDLAMKYGATIDGPWNVIAIIDAKTGKPREPFPVNPLIDGVINAMASLRESVGRPQNHFGITPIAIYKPLEGLAEAEVEKQPVQQDAVT